MNSTLYTKPVDAFQNRNHKQSINTSAKKGQTAKERASKPIQNSQLTDTQVDVPSQGSKLQPKQSHL